MELCFSRNYIPIPLSATKRYTPEQIREACRRKTGPFYLVVDGKRIEIKGEDCLMLACQVSCAYHDWIAYNAPLDDGFEEDMAMREAIIAAELEDPNTDDSEGG
jgi:hypothetical protein